VKRRKNQIHCFPFLPLKRRERREKTRVYRISFFFTLLFFCFPKLFFFIFFNSFFFLHSLSSPYIFVFIFVPFFLLKGIKRQRKRTFSFFSSLFLLFFSSSLLLFFSSSLLLFFSSSLLLFFSSSLFAPIPFLKKEALGKGD